MEAKLDFWCMSLAGLFPTGDTTILESNDLSRTVKVKKNHNTFIVFEMVSMRHDGDVFSLEVTGYCPRDNIMRHMDGDDYVIKGGYTLRDIDVHTAGNTSTTLTFPPISMKNPTVIRNLLEQLLHDTLCN